MRRLIILLAVAIAITVTAVVYLVSRKDVAKDTIMQVSPKETLSSLKERGELLYKARHYKVLIATYEKMLKAAPDNKEIKEKLERLHQELSLIEGELNK